MPTTDTTENGLETLIVGSLVGDAKYVQGDAKEYDREHALDWPKLLGFLKATQPTAVAALNLDTDSPKQMKFSHSPRGRDFAPRRGGCVT